MKKYINLFIAIVVSSMMTAACSDFDHNINVPETEYTFDINSFVATSAFEVPAAGQDCFVCVTGPFETTIIGTTECDIEKTNGGFLLQPVENPDFDFDNKASYANNPYGNIPNYDKGKTEYNLTRDVELYVRPLMIQEIKGYGNFKYPIRIRQRGTDGTYYLTAEQIRDWKKDHRVANEKMFGNANNHYVLAKVKTVGAITVDTGRYCPNTTIGDLWFVPAEQAYYSKPQNIEAIDITLDVDGEELNIKVHYNESYHLVQNLGLKTNDSIEVFVPNHGIEQGDNVIWVSPMDIFKK